ncbi:MAG: hypothetical protein ACFE9T_05950 [Promethearchaeota archaeon]
MSNTTNILSLKITQFPQNLIIPNVDNIVSLQATNNSHKNEIFNFSFKGENLNITAKPDGLSEQVEFNPGETKNIELKLIPTNDGFGKLTIYANWLKIVQYTVKVQKLRDVASTNKLNGILGKKEYDLSKSVDLLNPKEYLVSIEKNELKQLEKEYVSMKSSPELSTRDINNIIKQLAKGYLANNNPQKALELTLELSDNTEKMSLYYNLIRAYASVNFDYAFQLIQGINDTNLKQTLYYYLAFDRIEINTLQAINLSNLISDELLQAKVLIYIAKKLNEKNDKLDLINILNQIITILTKSLESNSENKKVKKKSYEFLKDVIWSLAEIESPQTADGIIAAISSQELKEKVNGDLFNVIYEMVDEVRTKVESTLVSSQYYLLNTYTSTVNENLKKFSLIGGNVSNNLLVKDFNLNVALLSLFSFEFSIFPILDRLYNDLRYNLNKSIAYYILPSKENYNESELGVLNYTLNLFFSNLLRSSNQVFVYNLDFIPYLGKPTIIVSSGQDIFDFINSKIKKLGDSVNVIIDNSLFKGGKIVENLIQVFPSNKCRVINLVLSYEFINDYNTFKAFIQLLI